MVAEEGGLFAEGSFAAEAVEFFLLGEDGGIIGAAVLDEVMKDAGEFMGRGGDGFRGAEPGFHPAEEVAEGALAALEALGGHAQGGGGAAFHIAGATERTRPPVMRLSGQRPSQEAKCLGLAKRSTLGPTSLRKALTTRPSTSLPIPLRLLSPCFAGRAPG